MAEIENLFDGYPEALDDEFTEVLVREAGVRVERIVSRGHASPEGFWYDQEEDEWVVMLAGSAGLLFEGEEGEVVLRRGDHVFIRARRRHRVAWTAPGTDTVWLAIFFPPGSTRNKA
jgi:cupin 2 domain-containing protein